jgi:hypothetical protein
MRVRIASGKLHIGNAPWRCVWHLVQSDAPDECTSRLQRRRSQSKTIVHWAPGAHLDHGRLSVLWHAAYHFHCHCLLALAVPALEHSAKGALAHQAKDFVCSTRNSVWCQTCEVVVVGILRDARKCVNLERRCRRAVLHSSVKRATRRRASLARMAYKKMRRETAQQGRRAHLDPMLSPFSNRKWPSCRGHRTFAVLLVRAALTSRTTTVSLRVIMCRSL